MSHSRQQSRSVLMIRMLTLAVLKGILLSSVSWTGEALAQKVQLAETYKVVELVVTGAERTDKQWLTAYLDLPFPSLMTREEALRVGRKLMTTGVFRDVKVLFEPHPGASDAYDLHVHLEEKWTTIPVVRAVFGGGIPLRVFGMYDIHVMGRLLTLGGEMRQYGSAPPGYVLYWRNPRAESGRSYFGAEVWREFRDRWIYDSKGALAGDLLTNMTWVRTRFFRPFGGEWGDAQGAWRYGLDTEVAVEARPQFKPKEDSESPRLDFPTRADAPPSGVGIPLQKWAIGRILPSLIYDDIELDLMGLDGFRMKGRAGPILGAGKPHSLLEADMFAYKMVGSNTNLAAHVFGGYSTLNTVQSRYFLGGLDSVRGLPDGYLHGTRAVHTSLEARHILLRAHRLWIQSVTFMDAATAGELGQDLGHRSKASLGLGVRLSIPQVHRMIFRIDYAWTLDGSGLRGITAGMGQFFDPYTPL